MQSRYLHEFAKPILDLLEQGETVDLPVYVRIESEQAVRQLKKLLTPPLNTSAPVLLENELLNKLKQFLEDRWQRIVGTDAIYPHHANSLANRACIALADILVPVFNVSKYKLLMPTVKMTPDFSSEHFNNFILTDTEIAIDVVKSLDEASNHHYNEFFTPVINGLPPRSLTKLERQRIINHSTETHDYFYSFFRQNSDKKLNPESVAVRDNLLTAINTGSCAVTASYHEQSHIRLVNIIISDISDIQALGDFISTHFVRSEWAAFLARISNVDFFNILISKKTNDDDSDLVLTDEAETCLDSILLEEPPLFENENTVKAYLICLLEAYMRIRRTGPDYTTYVGRYVGSMFPWATGTYSKEDKMTAGNILREFLLTDHSVSDLYQYLRTNDKQDYWTPISDDTLGQITRLAKRMESTMTTFRL